KRASASTTGTAVRRFSSRNSPDTEGAVHGPHRSMRLFEEGSRGARFRTLPRRARKAHLQRGQQGSLAVVDEAPDHAGEREPAQPCRPARPSISGPPDGAVLLRRRGGAAGRLCAAQRVLRYSPAEYRFLREFGFRRPYLAWLSIPYLGLESGTLPFLGSDARRESTWPLFRICWTA